MNILIKQGNQILFKNATVKVKMEELKKFRIYNSLTRKINTINLDKEVQIYLCGPTVYSDIHIGNIRPPLLIDVIIRSFEKGKINFKYVQNITDVDDKIIDRAKKEKKTESEISNFYKESYIKNLKKLDIIEPELHLVTNNIDKIINFIKKIENNFDLYKTEQNVIFKIENKKEEYSKLSNQKIEKLSSEKGRKVNKSYKLDRKDFILWKKIEEGIGWNSPWFEKGRPGWHTECAALIDHLFNHNTIDIHAGGKDLKFPHHENERIQYISANDKEIAKLWIHFGHINFKEKKMSKSLENVLTLKEYFKKNNTNSLKILIFSSKYNEDIEIKDFKIQQASAISKKIFNVNKKVNFFLFINEIKSLNDEKFFFNECFEKIFNLLETPKLISMLEKEISFLNKSIKISTLKKFKNELTINSMKRFYFICDILGLSINKNEYNEIISKKIMEWKEFIKNKDFNKADEIRKYLQENSII
jgi:cysteinyl-tRNA synthetase